MLAVALWCVYGVGEKIPFWIIRYHRPGNLDTRTQNQSKGESEKNPRIVPLQSSVLPSICLEEKDKPSEIPKPHEQVEH